MLMICFIRFITGAVVLVLLVPVYAASAATAIACPRHVDVLGILPILLVPPAPVFLPCKVNQHIRVHGKLP